MACAATPSRWCVCQFHHFRIQGELHDYRVRRRRDFSTRNRHQSKELIGAVTALAEPEMPGDSELEA